MQHKSSPCVLLRGSDSTCLRRLGLSPGSIFAALFCDPVDFEGGEITMSVCENLHLQPVNCPICPPVWTALHRYTSAVWMCADAAVAVRLHASVCVCVSHLNNQMSPGKCAFSVCHLVSRGCPGESRRCVNVTSTVLPDNVPGITAARSINLHYMNGVNTLPGCVRRVRPH